MNMNHFGGMKREREDDDEVNAKPLAKHQTNQSLTILSTFKGHSSEEELGGFQPRGDGARAGKKTKGRVKIKMEFIDNKLRRSCLDRTKFHLN